MQKAREETTAIGNMAAELRVPSREKGWRGGRQEGTGRRVRGQKGQ